MVSAGDRIRLSLNKGTDREGVVTGVTGSMLRVRWSSKEETSVVPAPGTITVLGRSRPKASRPGRKAAASMKKATGTRTSATKKATSSKAPSKKGGTTTRASAGKLVAKRAPSKKSTGTTSKSGTAKRPAPTKRGAAKKTGAARSSTASRRPSR